MSVPVITVKPNECLYGNWYMKMKVHIFTSGVQHQFYTAIFRLEAHLSVACFNSVLETGNNYSCKKVQENNDIRKKFYSYSKSRGGKN